MGVHSPQKKAALDTSQHFAVPVWQISPQHFKRHRAKGEKRGRTHETAVKRGALISWPSSMDEFHTRLKTCPPKRERNLSPSDKNLFSNEPSNESSNVREARKKKKEREKEEKRKRGWYVSRGAPVLKKRGQKSRGTLATRLDYIVRPRSCVGGNARGGMKRGRAASGSSTGTG